QTIFVLIVSFVVQVLVSFVVQVLVSFVVQILVSFVVQMSPTAIVQYATRFSTGARSRGELQRPLPTSRSSRARPPQWRQRLQHPARGRRMDGRCPRAGFRRGT